MSMVFPGTYGAALFSIIVATDVTLTRLGKVTTRLDYLLV